MSETSLLHSDGEPVRWSRGGKRSVLATYVKLTGERLGEHWLWCAVERIASGEPEAQVMQDYGYVREQTALRRVLRDAAAAASPAAAESAAPGQDPPS